MMLRSEPTTTGMRIDMSATLENIDEAEALVVALLEKRAEPIDPFALRILLREALLNAVTHGSANDPSKEVHCSLDFDAEGACLRVSDSGPGFAWRECPPELELDGDGGRGLPLMRIYAGSVIFSEKGNAVELRRAYDASRATVAARMEDV